jgi:hypothetical protein
LTAQPPNSPDFNVLDLGFFNSIQALQHQESPRTIDDLITAVEHAFEILPREKLDNAFITLQKCLECALLDGGGNSYKLPHLSKAKLRRAGTLPDGLPCSTEALEKAKILLN